MHLSGNSNNNGNTRHDKIRRDHERPSGAFSSLQEVNCVSDDHLFSLQASFQGWLLYIRISEIFGGGSFVPGAAERNMEKWLGARALSLTGPGVHALDHYLLNTWMGQDVSM